MVFLIVDKEMLLVKKISKHVFQNPSYEAQKFQYYQLKLSQSCPMFRNPRHFGSTTLRSQGKIQYYLK